MQAAGQSILENKLQKKKIKDWLQLSAVNKMYHKDKHTKFTIKKAGYTTHLKGHALHLIHLNGLVTKFYILLHDKTQNPFTSVFPINSPSPSF